MPEPDDPSPPPSPAPPAAPQPTPHASGGWWIAWILSTVIAPGLVVPVFNGLPPNDLIAVIWWVFVAAVPVLHIYSSVKLGRNRSGCLVASLILGGWLLMAISAFVGCVSVMNNMNHR